ncbi:DUF1549 domain-containing protein [bacterium]|nr:DUF1549 domain-containing protein [bacterium]
MKRNLIHSRVLSFSAFCRVAALVAVVFAWAGGAAQGQSLQQLARQQRQAIAKAKSQAIAKAKANQQRLMAEYKKAASAKPKLPVVTPDPNAVAVKPVDPAKRDAALASAAKLDSLIEELLTKNGQKPNAMTNDYQFVRRAYLDITGTIPTATQANAFIADKSKTKRADLIDRLLNSPGYASHMFNYWVDVLRLVDRSGNRYLRPFGDWLKDGLRTNERFDAMVFAMLTAEGRVFDDPAAGYLLRDAGMPLDNLNNTVRIFLGTRIGCAQCHDHPFDKWKQKDFYQLAAFSGGIQYAKPPQIQMDIDRKELQDKKFGQFRNVILNNNRQNVWDNDKVKLKYPHDYDSPGAKPGEVVVPAVLWGSVPTEVRSMPGRVQFAGWVTSEENPRFSRTLANRLWKLVMGRGLIEPLDDMHDDTVAANEAAMRFLETEIVRLNFDMKEFLRIVLNSRTYQRQVTYDDFDPSKPYLFPGPVLRRMTAEQVWDSLLTLTVPNVDAIARPSDAEFEELIVVRKGEKASEAAVRAEKLPEVQKSARQADETSLYVAGDIAERLILRRASELPSPLPPGHFLREFGQSDRELIGAGHTDGTVPQLLEMFNGAASHMIIENGSVLDRILSDNRTMNATVNEIFMSILTRHPTEREKRVAYGEANANGRPGIGNVIWALLNTREFLFVQ